jgi:hypothetical protein
MTERKERRKKTEKRRKEGQDIKIPSENILHKTCTRDKTYNKNENTQQ